MNPFDIGALIIIGLFIIRTAFVGFIGEIANVAWLVIAGLFSWLFSGLLGDVLVPYLGPGPHCQIIAIAVISLISFILVRLLIIPLRDVLDSLELNAVDHVLGALVGIIEGIVVVFLLFIAFSAQQVWHIHDVLAKSVTAQVLAPFVPWAQSLLYDAVKNV